MSSLPTVPARPARSPNRDAAQQAPNMPEVPPRPQRASAKSPSVERDSARSPFIEGGFATSDTNGHSIANKLTEEDLKRPPSVASLPLVGQEGMEYASLTNPQHAQVLATQKAAASDTPPKTPNETRNVASDLPLHAPTASASPATQKTRVAAVTRTDSEMAAVAGVGKPKTDYAPPDRSTMRPPSAAETERPGSAQARDEEEHGIPTFGATIPLYPNAGDVQAPTPAPGSAAMTPDLSRPGTTDGRRRSAMGFHGPPGSYGLHGHGNVPHDKFERAWYERHPEELAKEEEHIHHPAAHDERPEWAMSSDQLNKLVHESGRSPAFGTNPDMIGTPTEAIGYEASAKYASPDGTPHATPPLSATKPRRTSRPSSSSYAESPLKKAFSAADFAGQPDQSGKETLDDDKLHLAPPTGPRGKYTGGGYDPPTENLGPEGGNTDEKGGYIDERGEGVPILASDEIAKYPSAEWQVPAISPAQQMTEGEYFSAAENDAQPEYQTSHSRSRSRGHSRPTSMHSLSRFGTHEDTGTPLEEIEEYEPLFDDDEEKPKVPKRPTDRLKQQHFPSRDIWEDSPDSLNLVTTVDTPEPAARAPGTGKTASALFEPPEKERQRQGEFTESERKAALQDPSKGLAKPKYKSGVQAEVQRPGMRHRFPSQDIWEDTPDSLSLTTTVGESEPVGASQQKSPESPAKPSIPARPARSTAAKPELNTSKIETPSVPARPQARDIPAVPGRPKPSVPSRPARSLNKEPSDPSPLSKTSSAESGTSPPDVSTKPKPAVPARPVGGSSKFAAIKAGFMNDLNSRLSKGAPPPKPVKEESPKEEEDKAPLSDARKGRARGPARRKPAASPSPAAEAASGGTGNLSIASPWSVWSIADSVTVATGILPHASTPAPTTTAKSLGELPTSSPLSTNTAGEHLQPKSETPDIASGRLAHAPSPAMDARAHRESKAAKQRMRAIEAEKIGFEGDVPEPIVAKPGVTQPTSPPAIAEVSQTAVPQPLEDVSSKAVGLTAVESTDSEATSLTGEKHGLDGAAAELGKGAPLGKTLSDENEDPMESLGSKDVNEGEKKDEEAIGATELRREASEEGKRVLEETAKVATR